MRNYICLFLFLSCFHLSWGQEVITLKTADEKTVKTYKKALSIARSNDYKKAIKELDKLLSKKPGFIDAILLKSGMYYNLGELESTVDLIENAIQLAPDYKPLMYYTLGNTQREMEDYLGAAESYKIFVEKTPDHDKSKRADFLYRQSLFIADGKAHPVPFTPVNLGPNINTDHSEYIPLQTIDGSRIVFTRRVGGQEDFYIAMMEGDTVVTSSPIRELNTPYNEGVHTVSADGKLIIYTACDRRYGEGSCDLYYSKYKNGHWSSEMSLSQAINTPQWDGQPSLSADGRMLFYSSKRKGGLGGSDIWFTIKTDTAGWAAPRPLPDNINTPRDDESPFIHPDGETLYFRSNGHIGMGGFDIFYTRYNHKEKKWDDPKNIGYPINTQGEEGALSVSLDGKTAFFASDMAHLDKEKKQQNLDIYKFDLYEEARPRATTFLMVSVIDKKTKMPLEASYFIKNQNQDYIVQQGIAEEGSFLSALPAYSNYTCIINKDGYVYRSEFFQLDSVQSVLEPFVLEIELSKLEVVHTPSATPEKRDPIVMNNIFFISGSSELITTSFDELDQLYETLKANKNIHIQVIGHTDNVGQEKDNLTLSENRAKAVTDYLIKKGIDRSRVSYIGKGEASPIDTNDNPEGRKRNRRTEFIIQ